jgi:hypothetical protein
VVQSTPGSRPSAVQSFIELMASMTFWREKSLPALRRPSTNRAALSQPFIVFSLAGVSVFSIHFR